MSTEQVTETDRGRRRLRVAYAVIVVGALLALTNGRQNDRWPLHAWAVYDEARFVIPGTPRTALEARAVTASGDVVRLSHGDLVDESRNRTARRAIAESIDDPEWRPVLAHLTFSAVGSDVVAVEVWEVTYDVDPLAAPALDRDAPLTERLRLSLTADELELGR